MSDSKVTDALKLMVYDKRIYMFLKENDPKALEQVLGAIKIADPNDTKTEGIIGRWDTRVSLMREMLDNVEVWDKDALISYVQNILAKKFDEMGDEELKEQYDLWEIKRDRKL